MSYLDAYILNTDTKINVNKPEKNGYYNREGSVVIVRKSRTGTLIAIQSSGKPFEQTIYNLHADQSGRYMGMGHVLGTLVDGVYKGIDAPVSIPLYVFK